jgi:starvation-inducible DNA-binding protein
MSAVDAEARENLEADELRSPTARNSVAALSGKINQIISDSFLLCLKSKNFHRRVSGLHFRNCHLMLEEHTDSLLGTADPPADRGGATIRSLGQVAGSRTLADNEDARLLPEAMLLELMGGTNAVVASMRQTHKHLCDDVGDVAAAFSTRISRRPRRRRGSCARRLQPGDTGACPGLDAEIQNAMP